MHKILNYLLLIFIFSSCGLRDSRTSSANVFFGTWNVSRISCYINSESSTELERYEFLTVSTVTMRFSSTTLEYTSNGTCTTSSTGRYLTDFNGTNTGIVDFYDILTGGTTCDETIVDSGSSAVGSQTINTTLVGPRASNLTWIYDSEQDVLEIEYFGSFNGSSETFTCSGVCFCTAVLEKSS